MILTTFVILIVLCNFATSDASIRNDLSKQIKSAISEATTRIELLRIQSKIPAISVGVSYRGEEIWTDCFGYANLETGTPCTSRSLHRIGSVTKSVSTLLFGKLLEENRFDLDRPIYEYLGDKFPRKTFNGSEVNITMRQLVTHTGGIRHYGSNADYFKKVDCGSIYESLDYFKDDPLIDEPGRELHYSSYGFVTIAAVLQSVLTNNETFESAMLNVLKNQLGMRETIFDEVSEITVNRVSFYEVNDANQLKIAPFFDSSCKWPGGGMLSNVHDMLKMGNVMIASSKTDSGFLRRTTVDRFWQKVAPLYTSDLFDTFYGMGWEIHEKKQVNCSRCDTVPFSFAFGHNGRSPGALAELLIVPEEDMVVSLLTNVTPVDSLREVIVEIVSTFVKYMKKANYSREDNHGNSTCTNPPL